MCKNKLVYNKKQGRKEISEQLIAFRMQKNLTQREAAEQAGINYEMLKHLERGIFIHFGQIQMLAHFYGKKAKVVFY